MINISSVTLSAPADGNKYQNNMPGPLAGPALPLSIHYCFDTVGVW